MFLPRSLRLSTPMLYTSSVSYRSTLDGRSFPADKPDYVPPPDKCDA